MVCLLGFCFLKDDIPIISGGGFTSVIGVRHDGNAGDHGRFLTEGFLVILVDIAFLTHPLIQPHLPTLHDNHDDAVRIGIRDHHPPWRLAFPDVINRSNGRILAVK